MMSPKRLEEMRTMANDAMFGAPIMPSADRLALALKDAIAEIEELQKKLERFTEGPTYP